MIVRIVVDGSFRGSYPITNAFDGSLDTVASTNGKSVRFTCPIAFDPGVSLGNLVNKSAEKTID